MLRNYVAIAFRQLWKNQLFSAINIVGLTVGLAVSMFIALYVWHEFHYDRFEPFADRTYQIVSVAKYGDQEITFSGLHESFGRAIKQQIPEAEAVVRFSAGLGEVVLQSDQNHRFKESAIGFADQSMLSVMGLRLLHGDAKTALSEPSRMVLTRQLAEKYFGAQNPVGKTLIFDKQYPFTVSGVLDDLPTNSVIQFNGLASLNSMPALGARHQDIYQRTGFLTTYLVLRQGAKVSLVEKKLDKVKVGVNFVDASAKIFLEPLLTLHLGGHGDGARNERQSLYILLTVALVILVLAVINYVSLTTARATKRAREVGVRKAIGGQRSELVSQFFVESFLTTTLAFLLSLTQSRASRYFPGLSPRQLLNRTLVYEDTLQMQIAGIVADLPYASDFRAQEFVSVSTFKKVASPEEWSNTNSSTQLYLMVQAGVNYKQLEGQLNDLSRKNSEAATKKWSHFKRWHLVQPLADLHFGVEYHERERRANKNVLYGLIGLAGFILTLAVINYVNLASAQIPQRAREIGIRKTLGSRRRPLIMQFLGETAVITLLAFVLAYGLSGLFFTNFSDLVPEGMDQHTNWVVVILFLVALLAGVTLLAGLYPGWLITRFKPVAVLRGQTGYTLTEGQNRLTLRKSLIIFQFFVAQLFIVGALIVNQQLTYSLQADMGFVRDAILMAQLPWKSIENQRIDKRLALKQELQRLPGVAAVSLGDQLASNSYSSNVHQYVGKKGTIELTLFRKHADTDYIPFYKIPLLAGRNLQPSDTVREYILNETAVRALGFDHPQQAIGAFLKENGGDANRTVPIVGVVRDFHTRSFKEKIQPVALMTDRDNLSTFNIKLTSGRPTDWQTTIGEIRRVWKQFYAEAPFDYQFYDQTLEEFYKQELQLSRVVNLATAVAILISCLGLFGLATLTAHQRTKEIGVRKVLGASVASVVALLSKDFVKLVIVAIGIASPLAWYVMNRWLEEFAYKIAMPWWVFVLAGVLATGIALLTVSYQSVKAALLNPVKSLRSE